MFQRPLCLLGLFVAALSLFWNLSYAPFWNPDEGRYSAASSEMAFGLGDHGPDWLVPHLDTVARLNKPPLIYWSTAALMRILGPSETAARLPSAFAALGVLLVLFGWGRALFGIRAGVAAALVWATAIFPFAMARVANTDMLLCASIALAGCGIYWAIETSHPWRFGLLAGVGMGLALLAKGPVGVALPLAIGFVYLCLIRGWKRAPWGALALALALAFGLGAPWYWSVETARPGFLHQFIFAENLGRFSGGAGFHKPSPKWVYVPVLLGGMLPWTGFLLPALGQFEALTTRAGRAKAFLVIWAVFIALFFSFSGTKLVSYVLPAFPALALLTGAAVAHFETWPRWARRFAVVSTLLFNALAAFALFFKPQKLHGTRGIALTPGVLLDDKIVPREVGAPWTWILLAVVALGSVLLLLAARRPSGKSLLLAQGTTGLAFLGVLTLLAGKIAQYEDGSALLRAVQPQLKSDDRVAGYLSFLPTSMVYTQRPTTFFGFRNTSGLDESELKTSPYFRRPDQFEAYLNESKSRTFVLADGPIWPAAQGNLTLWGRNNDWFLYANTPKPADFGFEFFARRKTLKKSKMPED